MTIFKIVLKKCRHQSSSLKSSQEEDPRCMNSSKEERLIDIAQENAWKDQQKKIRLFETQLEVLANLDVF